MRLYNMRKKPNPDEWERVDKSRVSLSSVHPNKYRMTYEKGQVVYWKRKK